MKLPYTIVANKISIHSWKPSSIHSSVCVEDECRTGYNHWLYWVYKHAHITTKIRAQLGHQTKWMTIAYSNVWLREILREYWKRVDLWLDGRTQFWRITKSWSRSNTEISNFWSINLERTNSIGDDHRIITFIYVEDFGTTCSFAESLYILKMMKYIFLCVIDRLSGIHLSFHLILVPSLLNMWYLI